MSLSVLFHCLKLKMLKLLHNSLDNQESKIKTIIVLFCQGHSATVMFQMIGEKIDTAKVWLTK